MLAFSGQDQAAGAGQLVRDMDPRETTHNFCIRSKMTTDNPEKPKGTLIAIGGKENNAGKSPVLSRILHETHKPLPRVCLVTLASGLPERLEKHYRSCFGKEIAALNQIHYNDISQADTAENIRNVSSCDAVFFSGGDQQKLCGLLRGTSLLRTIRQRYVTEEHFVVAGTSAGAAALPRNMISRGSSRDAMLMGRLDLAEGLGFIGNVIIDTHFVVRGRFGRLIQAVATHNETLGIGLAENTSVIFSGICAETDGTGVTILIDGSQSIVSQGQRSKAQETRSVRNIRLHILTKGGRFFPSHTDLFHET